jgi:isoquinoline 1-oxidoreductase subunit alpha
MITLTVNNKNYSVDAIPSIPLLWAIRDIIGLTGTKFGCGVGLCGACTVHLNGEAVRSCITPVSKAQGGDIITIEGLVDDIGDRLRQAWTSENVLQCGYCQSGQIMSASVLLKKKPVPTDQDINDAMSGNICRCGTYQRIRKAIHAAASSGKIPQ